MTSRSITGRDPETGDSLTVQITNGHIDCIEKLNYSVDSYISAGLIDLQVNGFKGLDLNDGNLKPETVVALTELMLSTGVTTFVPTLVTASQASLLLALKAIARARNDCSLVGHSIPYVHVEGPFVSPEDGPRGAHPSQYVRPPDIDEVAEWQRVSGNLVGKITLSPHYDDIELFIQALVSKGILVAIGHTSATPEQVHRAAAAGACFSTHLGNGAAANIARHPNFIWAQLADDRLTASFIADGFHLSKDTFKAMLRSKGLHNSVLVSDLAALGGMAAGYYDTVLGGRVRVNSEGCLTLVGTPYLAGAGSPLRDNVASAICMADLTLAEGLQLATANPGRFVGGKGRLLVGASADLILFNGQKGSRTLNIHETLVRGQVK